MELAYLSVSTTGSVIITLTRLCNPERNRHTDLSLLEVIHCVWPCDDTVVISLIVRGHELEVELSIARDERVPSDVRTDEVKDRVLVPGVRQDYRTRRRAIFNAN